MSDFSRPILIHVCRDGTVTYRTRKQPIFNGRALPVFSVETEEQAKGIQVRFCRKQYNEHPKMPGKPWYILNEVGGSELEIDELPEITRRFRDYYESCLDPATRVG